MKIAPFLVEEWMNANETRARYNLAETCVDSISLRELFSLTGEDEQAFWQTIAARRMTYGDIVGNPAFLTGICGLYQTVKPEHLISTHGAAGANDLLFSSLIGQGDRVVSVMPTYQQLYSIPESLGAEVEILRLRRKDGYLPDLGALKQLTKKGVKLICINNPNNPTGALIEGDMLAEIVQIARDSGAYLLCDEVYRHLTQSDLSIPSVVDLYEKGISVSGMSKVFSLAGLRLGWIATKDAELKKAILSHRDYRMISCGLLDEAVAAVALKGAGALLLRNRTLIRENLRILREWIRLQPHLSFVVPKAGTTALIHYDFDLDSNSFCRRLLDETGVFVTPGDCFEEPKSIRMGYACATEELKKGLNAFDAFLNTL